MSNTANFSANRAKLSELKTHTGKQDTIIAHHVTAHAKHDTGHAHQVDIKTKLDTIATNTANIKVSTDSVNLNVDGLETLQGTTNSKLDTIITNTASSSSSGLSTEATLLLAKNALFTNPAGSGNTIGENASAINSNIITGNSKLDTINTTLTAGGVVDTSALATHAKQDTIKNEITALKNSLTGDGAGGDNAGGVMLKAINDNIINTNTVALAGIDTTLQGQDNILDDIKAELTSGLQQAKIMGSEDGSTSGTQRQLHVNSSGQLQIDPASVVAVAPSNSFNSDNSSHVNSFAVGIRARTNISSHSTGTFLLCDSNGRLAVINKTGIVNHSEVSYVSGQSITGSGTHTGASITVDANTKAFYVEHNFSHTGIKYEILGSIDGSNFFSTGVEFNAGGLSPATLTGLSTILGTSSGVIGFPPFIKFKFSNSDSSAQTATLSYVQQIS